jgi:hypothetical protein
MAKKNLCHTRQGYTFIARQQFAPIGKTILVPPMVVHTHALMQELQLGVVDDGIGMKVK